MGNFEFSNCEPTGAERSFATGNAGIRAEAYGPRPLAPSGAEVHSLAVTPHFAGLESTSLAAVPGAHEPISPLIQLIMRMPGHLGLLSSLFEAMQNLFLPHVDFLSNLDPSALFGSHGAGPLEAASSHGAVAWEALPSDAHILQGLADGGANVFHGSSMHLHNEGVMAARDTGNMSENVSGQSDILKPQYEGLKAEQSSFDRSAAGGHDVLSGPAMLAVNPTEHLAGTHTVFSQRLFEGIGNNHNSLSTAGSASQSLTASTSQPSSAPADLQPLHASGDITQTHPSALSASGHFSDSTGGGTPGTYGPSGAVSEILGGKHLIAMHHSAGDVAPPFLDNGASASEAYNQIRAIGGNDGNAFKPLTALKAKELSLNDVDGRTIGGHQHQSLSKTVAHGHHSAQKAMSHAAAHSGQRSSVPAHGASTAPTMKQAATHSQSVVSPDSSGSDMGGKPALSSDQTTIAADPGNASGLANYTVKTGDSLWNIAKARLGDASRWPDIYKMNMDKIGANANLIHTGNTLQMPSDAGSVASTAGQASRYIVHNGENLWNISGKMLGSHERWGELYKLNQDLIGNNPRLIVPGQELRLPGGSDTTSTVADASVSSPVAPSTAAVHGDHQQLAEARGGDLSNPDVHTNTVAAPPPPSAVTAPAPTSAYKLVLNGPGGASAANLDFARATAAHRNSLVSPSLAPDLSFLARKR